MLLLLLRQRDSPSPSLLSSHKNIDAACAQLCSEPIRNKIYVALLSGLDLAALRGVSVFKNLHTSAKKVTDQKNYPVWGNFTFYTFCQTMLRTSYTGVTQRFALNTVLRAMYFAKMYYLVRQTLLCYRRVIINAQNICNLIGQ